MQTIPRKTQPHCLALALLCASCIGPLLPLPVLADSPPSVRGYVRPPATRSYPPLKKELEEPPSAGKNRFWFSGGISNQALGAAPTIEAGLRPADSSFGYALTVVLNSQTAQVDTSTAISCNNGVLCYQNVGVRRKGPSLGVDLKYFLFADSSSFQPLIGVGLYFTRKVSVARSVETGKQYILSKTNSENNSETVELRPNLEAGFSWDLGWGLVGASYGLTKYQLSLGILF